MMGFRRSPGAREFINVSWKQVIPIVSEKIGTIANQNPNQISGVIGQFIDEETILTFKRFFNQLGVESSNIFIQDPGSKWNRNINIDFRANYLLGTKLNELEKEGVDFVLLLGSTPRHEASALNVRLRALGMKKNTSISSVGFPTDLTYPVDQLGTGLKTIYQLAHGKHSTLYQILKAKNPIIILGFNAYQREDGDVLKDTCD